MLRCFFFTLVACSLVAIVNADDVDANGLAWPFQEQLLLVPAVFEQSIDGFPPEYPSIGRKAAFQGEGYLTQSSRAKLAARFTFSPAIDSPRSRYFRSNIDPVQLSTNQWVVQRYFENVRRLSGPLIEGDCVPMLGHLYRVSSIASPATSIKGAQLELTKIPREQWDDDFSLDPYSYAVTDGGSLELPGWSASRRLDLAYDVTAKHYEASITQEYLGPDRKPARSVKQITLEPGKADSIVMTRWIRFRVVSIVPPEPAKNIPGWVELRMMWPTIKPYGFDESLPVLQW